MKIIVFLITLFLAGIQTSHAAVSVRVCGPNELTPFDFSNIMVGQELTLIVSSDTSEYWSGGFFIKGDDRAIGLLAGRDSDPNSQDYTDSHYPAAGDNAKVTAWKDSVMWGFDMETSDSNCLAGDWFIIDYIAEKPGKCKVDFYDYGISWTVPETTFSFEHDPSCDFNLDGIVNFADFQQLASCWLADCSQVTACAAVDLDSDSIIDVNDLSMFVNYWLWDGSISPDTNSIEPTPDPNLVYSIVDANGLSEITVNTGESVKLYVDLATGDLNDLMFFDIEVYVSEPNSAPDNGTIDNSASPNGTAEILASPRVDVFDSWGPASKQENGISLSAFNFNPEVSISDGHLASFVYTAGNTGDKKLSIVNISSSNMENKKVYPTVKPILIHQVGAQ